VFFIGGEGVYAKVKTWDGAPTQASNIPTENAP